MSFKFLSSWLAFLETGGRKSRPEMRTYTKEPAANRE
jgi:hypothetical protein